MAFPKTQFTKRWTSKADFPTYEADETRVREDIQLLYDEALAAVHSLIDELAEGTAAANLGAKDPNGNPVVLQDQLNALANLILVDPDNIKDNNILLADPSALDLPALSTVQTALLALDSRVAERAVDQVGDVKITARSDLGDDWKACSGAKIKSEDYPDYAALRPPVDSVVSSGETSGIRRVATDGEGNYLAIGTTLDELYFSTDLTNAWTKVALSDTSKDVFDVAYGAGTWVVLGRDTATSPPAAFVLYSGTLTSTASAWTSITLNDLADKTWERVAFGDGRWALLGYTANGHLDVLEQDADVNGAPSGDWTHYALYSVAGMVSTHTGSLRYINGKWYACAVLVDSVPNAEVRLWQRGASNWASGSEVLVASGIDSNGVNYYCAFAAAPDFGDAEYTGDEYKGVVVLASSAASNTKQTKVFLGRTFSGGWAAKYQDSTPGHSVQTGSVDAVLLPGLPHPTTGTAGTVIISLGSDFLWTLPTVYTGSGSDWEKVNGHTFYGGLAVGDRWMLGECSSYNYVRTTLVCGLPYLTNSGVNTYIKVQ